MSWANYAACYAKVRAYEGGNDDDPRDPGGRTSRGITQAEYDRFRVRKRLARRDVWRADEAEIAEIYRTQYWDVVAGDAWFPGADLAMFDCAVNSGPARARRFAQGALNHAASAFVTLAHVAAMAPDRPGFVKRVCAARMSFLRGLSTFAHFGRGWTRRVADVEAAGVAMALAYDGVEAAAAKRKLQEEADRARQKAADHGIGATGTGAAGGAGAGGTAHQADWSALPWHDWLLIGLGAALVLGLVVFFLWWSHAHRARAAAFAEAAKS